MGSVFDQQPVVIPVPNDPELENTPIVQYVSSNGMYSCSFAKRRVDYYHFSSDKKEQYQYNEINDIFLKNVERYFDFFSKKVRINRVGFLTKFFVQEEKQGETIAKLISEDFRNIHGGSVRDAKLQYISRIETKNREFILNNNTTIEKTSTTLFGNSKEIQQNGVLITRDFNTVPEKVNEYEGIFTIEKIKQIIKEGEENFKLNDIAQLLWPTKE
jgi:hypothetical protein